MSSANNIVYRRWDQLIEQRFEVFQSIIRNRDKELMAAVTAHDRLSMVDWPATLNRHAEGSAPSVLADKDDVLKILKQETLKANDRINDGTKTILDTMKSLANKDANETEWNDVLTKVLGTFENNSLREMEDLRALSIDKNKSVDPKYQPYVAEIYMKGVAPVALVILNIAGVFMQELEDVGKWYRNPQPVIKECDDATKGLSQTAAGYIRKAYPDYIKGADSLSAIHPLADKDDVLRTLKDILLKTNQLIREDTNEISRNFEQLANKGGNEEEWVRALDEAEDLMQHKALDQMTEMKKFAINRINSVDGRYRNKVGEIFGHACTALTGFQGSVHLFIKVAKGTADKWYRNPWDNLKIFQRSTKIWYDGAEQGIKRAFPDYLLKGPSTLEDKDDILRELKPLLLQTNKDLHSDTDDILDKMNKLAKNKDALKGDWRRLLDDARDRMENKAQKQLTEMKTLAIKKLNNIDNDQDQAEAGAIFGKAFAALTSYYGSVIIFITTAKQTLDQWYDHHIMDNISTFQKSTQEWYARAENGINEAFPGDICGRNRNGEDSLSSIQEMATQLQGMGVDNITIIPKGDGWALEIGAGM